MIRSMRNVLSFRSPILRVLLVGLFAGSGGGARAQRHGGMVPMERRSAPAIREGTPAWRGEMSRRGTPGEGVVRGAGMGGQQQQPPAPIERRAPTPHPANGGTANGGMAGSPAGASAGSVGTRGGGIHGGAGAGRGEHLSDWMNQHNNLTPQQQREALEREPGFHELPSQQQQRMRERLSQLDAMQPEQRQRMLAHTEMMERLSPDQRTQVRGAMAQLGSLPPDQRQMVARSFRELRALPPGQRMAVMNSGQYRWMTPTQRSTLNNLMRVEPMIPPSEEPRRMR